MLAVLFFKKCNPKKNWSKVNENGEWNRSVPEVLLTASPLVPAAFDCRNEKQYFCPLHTKKTSGTQGIIYQVLSVISDLDYNKTTESS